MITKPTVQQVTALHSLVHQPAWKDVAQLLKAELQTTIQHLLVTADTATLHELRGRARVLDEILGLSEGTKELLEKMLKR